ncbi:serine/threonine protein phosphatase catalytic subunit, putative [Trypanosoma cruzi marinkellei]|uniref:Serine/threonine protein phosphatase catalytic subunit, putative n=1 Tax=Trypanosoma cruzi marinkellei TaxID=85056 RepID=K2P988_TRYCR|nr:serine/threonine protein phosphatase catalytic subunit, putative [Trypanosoma cruzi marinkellei]
MRNDWQTRLHTFAITRVEEHLHHLGAIRAAAPAAAHDVAWVDQVIQNVLEHRHTRAGALHLLQLVDILRALRDFALRHKHHNAAGKALLELRRQCALDLAHQHQEPQRVEDHRGRPPEARTRQCADGVDVKARQLRAECLVGRLQLKECLGNVILILRRVRPLELAELAQVWLNGHPSSFTCRGQFIRKEKEKKGKGMKRNHAQPTPRQVQVRHTEPKCALLPTVYKKEIFLGGLKIPLKGKAEKQKVKTKP